MKIIKANDYQDMSRKAANILSARVILYPRSVLGLATGSSPLGIYRQLVDWYRKGDLDFSEVRSVNLDEYFGLSPEDPQSYHYYMEHNFFSEVNIKPDNVHIPDGRAADPDAECAAYDRMIEQLGGIDLQLLGIGPTGHIGFNEPNDSFDKMTHVVRLKPETIKANSRFFQPGDTIPHSAFTMGIKAIMRAKKILLVVSGKSKADILEKALFGPITPEVPASILQLHPDCTVVADEEALSTVNRLHPVGR